MDERERLRKAIRDLHGVEATHLRSEPVHDVFPGQTVWEGVVEVFALNGHPKAGLALRVEPGDGRPTLPCWASGRSNRRAMPCVPPSPPKRMQRARGGEMTYTSQTAIARALRRAVRRAPARPAQSPVARGVSSARKKATAPSPAWQPTRPPASMMH